MIFRWLNHVGKILLCQITRLDVRLILVFGSFFICRHKYSAAFNSRLNVMNSMENDDLWLYLMLHLTDFKRESKNSRRSFCTFAELGERGPLGDWEHERVRIVCGHVWGKHAKGRWKITWAKIKIGHSTG